MRWKFFNKNAEWSLQKFVFLNWFQKNKFDLVKTKKCAQKKFLPNNYLASENLPWVIGKKKTFLQTVFKEEQILVFEISVKDGCFDASYDLYKEKNVIS
jgi:hypothetical protein